MPASTTTSLLSMVLFVASKHAFFFFLLLQITVLAHRRRPQQILHEKDALLAFKSSLSPQSQLALSNWNETTKVCDFEGVECDRWHHVVQLGLPGKFLSGPLSPVLANITGLGELDLSENQLTGRVPAELAKLRRLTILDLRRNYLTGAIPPSLANITGLEQLVLSENQLTGRVPAELAKLRRLTILDLRRNYLTGAIPPSLANITVLGELDLSENQLTGRVPAELAKLRRLTILDLRRNYLTGAIPPSLAEITSLIYLNLGGNFLKGRIPDSIFYNCTELQLIDLSDNFLSGQIPPAAAIALRFLRFLNLYLNNLSGSLPVWICNSSILIQLDAGQNNLSGELPTTILQNKSKLEVLHLSYNTLSSHDGNTNLGPFFSALANCSSLLELRMAGLGVGGSLLPLIRISEGTRRLSIVSLEDNIISGGIPPHVAKLFNLILLNLSSNLLSGAIPKQIFKLGNLQCLILSNNCLVGSIPPEIGNLSNVSQLDLSRNRLSGEIPSSIGKLNQTLDLYLHKNQLSGSIPAALGHCVNLNKLDLSYNRLTGTIPPQALGVAKIFFNLSNNQLQGPLPSELGNMHRIQEIDLSSNNLIGRIIPQLSACVELTLINLSHNHLSGQLPATLGDLKNLKALDVSFNDLSGEIPLSLNKCTDLVFLNLSYNDFNGSVPTGGVFSAFTNLSYLANARLCGLPSNNKCAAAHRRLRSRKLLIAVSLGASLAAFLLTTCCAVLIRKFKRMDLISKGDIFGGLSPMVKSSHPRITYRELVQATEEFSQERLIGSGGYGRVYRGVLNDGTVVAVKVLSLQSGNSTRSFTRECQVLKRIRHRNLMRIITACSLPDFKALVLPFMANGSLDDCLHSGSCELSLMQRVNICGDVAEGMAYLHHHSPVKVIHCDLKPSNVLLNDDMTALVSDFGIARLVTSVGAGSAAENVGNTTANMLCGSIGYIAPEYGYGSNASTRGDVYSFGVLVLELVTGRRPTDAMFEGGTSLSKWVKSRYHGQLDSVVDPAVASEARSQMPEVKKMWEVAIEELLELGLVCAQENPSSRPRMLDAADDLDRLRKYLSGDTTATFASSLGLSSSSTVGETSMTIFDD